MTQTTTPQPQGSGGYPRLAKLLRNVGIVFSGNVSNGIIGLLYLAVLTRALPIEQFGVYALFGAFVALVGRLTSFQAWKGLIQYGTEALAQDDKPLLHGLLRFGWLLDIASGVVGYAIALCAALLVPAWFGLGELALPGVAVAGAILMFNWTSAPTALFRIHDRFVPQAIFDNLGTALQLVTVSVLWALGETRLIVYLATTAANNIIGQLAFFAYAIRAAKREQILTATPHPIRELPNKCPGIWRFVVSTNADSMVRVVRDADIFVVNALLDVAAVGLYRIARTLTSALGKITGPFYQTIYPELARMITNSRTMEIVGFMRQASMMLGALTGAALITFVALGDQILHLAFGTEFVAAYAVTTWCMAGMFVWALALPLSPAIMALRKPQLALAIHFVTTIFYIALLAALVADFGLIGAGYALVSFHIVWALAMLATVGRQLNARALLA